MTGEIISIAVAIVTLIQLVKRAALGGVDAMDELSRRRPLKRYRELLESAGADSRLRSTLERERDSELFRQIFGKLGSLEIENVVIALRASGVFSTRELRHLLQYAPYDVGDLTSDTARASAVWNLWAAGLQSVLVATVIAMATLGVLAAPHGASLRFFIPVLAVSIPGFMVFVREGVHAHLSRHAIDRVREFRSRQPNADRPATTSELDGPAGTEPARAHDCA